MEDDDIQWNDALENALTSLEADSDSKKPKLDGQPPETSTTAAPAKVISVNSILVHTKQRGNPLLKSITNVKWEFDEIIPDYIVGRGTCVLYLSLKYHNYKPDYILERLKALGKAFELRILLVQIDMKEPHNALKQLTRICILANLTLMLAWNAEEAGKIIETYKLYENRPPDLIMERAENVPHQKVCVHINNIFLLLILNFLVGSCINQYKTCK